MESHSGQLHDGRCARLSSTLQVSLVVLHERKLLQLFVSYRTTSDTTFFCHFVIHDVFAATVSARRLSSNPQAGTLAVRVREYVYACTCTLAAYQLYVKRRFTYKIACSCTGTPAAYTIQLRANVEQTYTYSRTLLTVYAPFDLYSGEQQLTITGMLKERQGRPTATDLQGQRPKVSKLVEEGKCVFWYPRAPTRRTPARGERKGRGGGRGGGKGIEDL